jgi:hypothetical protein
MWAVLQTVGQIEREKDRQLSLRVENIFLFLYLELGKADKV